MTATKAIGRPTWLVLSAGLALLTCFVALRLDAGSPIANPDEIIVVKVASAMAARGDLDPNWALADLPGLFQCQQYNFYLYNVFSFLLLFPLAAFNYSIDALVFLRSANIAYQAVAVLLIYQSLKNLNLPPRSAILAVVLLVFAPAWVHDAHMARGESLLYLITSCALFALTQNSRLESKASALGMMLGLAISVKVSSLLFGLMGLPLAQSSKWLKLSIICAGSALTALLVSSPYLFVHPDIFLNGVRSLAAQYSGVHPPHSFLEYSLFKSSMLTTKFLLVMYGMVIPIGVAAPSFSRSARKPVLLGLWLASLATIVYFTTRTVFFERNISLAIMSLIVIAAVAIGDLMNSRMRNALICVCVLPLIYWSTQIALTVSASQPRFISWEKEQFSRRVVHWWEPFDKPPPEDCNYWFVDRDLTKTPAIPACEAILAIPDFGDEFSARLIARAEATGLKRVGEFRSRFSLVPTSTLHTYLETSYVYFECAHE